MNTHTQIIYIYMQSYIKKILLFILIALVLFVFLFFGTNYFKKQLASLSSIITAWVTINPLEVKVSAPAEVEIDKVFKVEARLINKGEEKIENAKAEISLTSGLDLIKKDSIQEIGVIPGKKEKKVSWSVKGIELGNHSILVKASGELRGEPITAEDTIMIKVVEFLPRGKGWLKNLFDLFQEWFRF